MKKLLFAGVAAVAISGGSAYAAFPGVNDNPLGPEFLITFSDSGVSTALNPVYGGADPGPYDGSDDVYFGVVNNSSKTISAFNISSNSSPPIGGFDGDGIVAYGTVSGNATDTTGYGGPNAFFTNISADLMSLTVNFITPIAANGGTDIFSLESAAKLNNIVIGSPEPSTWAMMLLGFVGLGFAGYRKAKSDRIALAI